MYILSTEEFSWLQILTWLLVKTCVQLRWSNVPLKHFFIFHHVVSEPHYHYDKDDWVYIDLSFPRVNMQHDMVFDLSLADVCNRRLICLLCVSRYTSPQNSFGILYQISALISAVLVRGEWKIDAFLMKWIPSGWNLLLKEHSKIQSAYYYFIT